MPKFTVRLARDLTEYHEVVIEADDEDDAHEKAHESAADPDTLEWKAGSDRTGVFVADCEEISERAT